MKQTNAEAVRAFHEKFSVPMASVPRIPDEAMLKYRIGFIEEELTELKEAADNDDIVEMADALIDILYVTYGFAHIMGLPIQDLWDEVQRSNMAKISGKEARENGIATKRPPRHDADVLKPLDWKNPDLESIIVDAIKFNEV